MEEEKDNKKRKWTPKEKLAIVLEGIASQKIHDVCDKYGISPSQFYEWKNKLFEKADDIYRRKDDKGKSKRIAKLEEALAKKDSVIAEVTTENLELKKKSWR
jgi:transposase-like protein